MKRQKITVTLRLYPEDALDVLSICRYNNFISDKQFVDKTNVAMRAIELPKLNLKKTECKNEKTTKRNKNH